MSASVSGVATAPARPLVRSVLKRPPRWARRKATRLLGPMLRRISIRRSYETISGIRRRVVPDPRQRTLRTGNLTVTRQSLYRAVLLLVIYRYCDRERLWAAGHATSALMGLLYSYLTPLLRRVRSRTGSYRLYWAAPALWFAGADNNRTDLAILREEGAMRLVTSFAEIARSRQWPERIDEGGFLAILDSGGFQCWKRGIQVDWEEWAAFVKRHEHRLLWYVQPDSPAGGVAENQALLLWAESLGLTPIPVYHAGMPASYLEWLLDRGYPVIAVGGHVGMPEPERRALLDRIRERIRPWAREHILGALDLKAWSSDSSVWLEARRSGELLTDTGRRRLVRRGEPSPLGWRELTRINVRHLSGLQRRLERAVRWRTGVQLRLGFLAEALPVS